MSKETSKRNNTASDRAEEAIRQARELLSIFARNRREMGRPVASCVRIARVIVAGTKN